MKCSYCGEEYVSGSRFCTGCHLPVEEAFGIISDEYLKQDVVEYRIDVQQEQVQETKKEQASEQNQQQVRNEQVEEQEDENEFITLLNIPIMEKQQAVNEPIVETKQETSSEEVKKIVLPDISLNQVPAETKQEQVVVQDLQNSIIVETLDEQTEVKEPVVDNQQIVKEQQTVQQNYTETPLVQQNVATQTVTQQIEQQVEQQVVQQDIQVNNTNTQQVEEEKPTEFPQPLAVVANNQNTITVDTKKVKDKDSIKLRRKAIAFVIILLVCGFVTWKVVGNNNQNLQTNNQSAALATEGNSIEFLGYTLTVPEGFIYNIYNGTDYIQNDDFVVMFKEESPLSYSYVMENKESIIASLNAQGLNVKTFESKKLYENDYVLIVGDKGEDKKEYGYMFGDLGGTNPICATIRSNSSNSFDTKWFSTTALFFATAKKQ